MKKEKDEPTEEMRPKEEEKNDPITIKIIKLC